MWQVITAPQNQRLAVFAGAEQRLSKAEIDELIEALVALEPSRSKQLAQQFPAPELLPTNGAAPPQNSLSFKKNSAPAMTAGVISALEIPRKTNAPDDPPLPPEARAQLLKLRTTIMLAAEQQQVRAVLLCGTEPGIETASIAAPLSRLMAEYERLRVAYLEVVAEDPLCTNRRKVLPFGYTFQIRRTKTPNLYELASSLGAVRLDDWLKWWEPTVVLREMKKMFDVILIQAPAITTNPDVALLAGAVDGVILVATENVTAYATIAEAQRRLEAAQARVLGVTLNQATPRPTTFSSVKSRVRAWMEARAK